jgi:hypothetical protein
VAVAAPEPVVAAAPRERSALSRLLGWFWRGRELSALRQARATEAPEISTLTARAKLLFACGERLTKPVESLPVGADAVAYDLYRRAAYWAIRALYPTRGGEDGAEVRAWSLVDAETRARLERKAATTGLEASVETADDGIWTLPPARQAQLAEQLRSIASAILEELESPARARDSLLLQRAFRIGAVFALVGVVLGLLASFRNAAEERNDLAIDKPWRTSSSYGSLGCTSPAQQCSESPDFFFHTRDESNSWIEIDLGKKTRFSALRVLNRADCCADRAVPLVIEVGDKPEAFHEVARRTSSFSSWLASFGPTEARYVRLRSTSRNPLHLARVRVLR